MINFAYPWFLAGMATAAIPLALHLMRREIIRDLTFPSIRFIRKGPVPKKGKRRLRDIILLLLRMALLMLLAIFFAAPFRPLRPAVVTQNPQRHIVLVDVSASMSAKGKKEQLVSVARKLADTRVNETFQVILSANGVVKTSPVLSPKAFMEFISAIQSGTATGKPVEALRQVVRQLEATPDARVHIISDFQLTDWSGEAFPKFPPDVSLDLIPIRSPASNLGIQSARPRRAGAGALHVQVDIRNDGAAARTTPVSLIVGTKTVTQTVECPAQKTTPVFIPLKDADSDIGLVRLDDDNYTLDNSFHLWLGAPEAQKLVAVFSDSDVETPSRELYFIRKALSIQPLNSRQRFEITQAPTTSFFALDLSDVDGLLLLGAAAYLEDAGFTQVKTFAEQGGTVLFTLSPAHPARQFMRLKTHGLLTVNFQGIISEQPVTGNPLVIARINEITPVGKLFAGVDDSDLFFMRIRKMARFTAYSPAETVFATRNDTPFLARQAVGKGDVYCFAVPLTTQWTDLPVSLSFLPIIQEIFTPSGSYQGVLSLVCAEGLPVRKNLRGEDILLNQPGWDNTAFDAPPQSGKIGKTPVEINVSRQESSLLKRPLTAVRLALTGSVLAQESQAGSSNVQQAKDLRPAVATLLLIVILLEVLLAGRLTEQTDASQPRRGGGI